MALKTQAPMTVLYRCDLRDTATLVGLVQARMPIGTIAYTGPLDKVNMDYIEKVNLWLERKSQPRISIHPYLSMEQLDRIQACPLNEWGWNDDECKAAISMAGLPAFVIYNQKPTHFHATNS